MTYYDRIQDSIDHIESHLEDELLIEDISSVAYMSVATYYRLFFALTGHSVKEYIRSRRMCLALEEFTKGKETVLALALKYGFGSHAAFTRACKRLTGQSPKAFKSGQKIYPFERINMMDKYIEVQDPELADNYPDIKLLKVLEPYRVAYYCYQGVEPESGAFAVISKWLQKSGLSFEKNKLRIFGFNNPSPSSPDQKTYGYEVWVTIGREVEVKDPRIKTKEIIGGLYAVCGVKDLIPGGDGAEIYKAWMRLNAWLKDSRYRLGTHQWLEEHLSFNDAFEHFGGMDLYMPLDKK